MDAFIDVGMRLPPKKHAFRAFALTPSDGDMLHDTKQTNKLVDM